MQLDRTEKSNLWGATKKGTIASKLIFVMKICFFKWHSRKISKKSSITRKFVRMDGNKYFFLAKAHF